MANTSPTATSGESTTEIELKDPRLAAFLAWLVPGLGHFYQGRTGKGLLFFVCILGTFFYGMYIGGGRVVYASTSDVISRQFLERWQYICQVGIGLPALPAFIQTIRVEGNGEPLFGDNFLRPPYKISRDPAGRGFESTDPYGNIVQHPDELSKWNYDMGERFEIGTVFTVIAGLLNILAIFDAYGGPLVIPPPEDKKQPAGSKSDQGAERKE